MKQTEIKNEKKYVKVEDGFKDDADVVKLDVGETIDGLLVDKKVSRKYGMVFKLKKDDDPRFKVLPGTVILNRKFEDVELNTEVKVERLNDKQTKDGFDIQDYDVWYIP